MWNSAETQSLRGIRAEEAALRQLIGESPPPAGFAARRTHTARMIRSVVGEGGDIDWKTVARKMGSTTAIGLLPDSKMASDLQGRIAEMGTAELLAALDEIRRLGLGAGELGRLESMLFDSLLEKDPAQALQQFDDRIGNDDDAVGWQLSGAMAQWAKRDPVAAAAWFDQQIASGAFEAKSLDGRSQARLEFEGALAGELLANHADAAAARIAALPEDHRREALEQISFSELDPEGMASYVGLIRELVPQDERAGSFTHVISDLVLNSGFDQVDQFLDLVRASPEERAVSAREAANARFGEIASGRPLTRQDMDAMRDWIEKQSPGSGDRVTGEALGDAAQDDGDFDFEAASGLALEYHRMSSNDELLVSFLESFAARSNAARAIHLANQIRDEQRRQEILEDLK
jgi:hypothetical protein